MSEVPPQDRDPEIARKEESAPTPTPPEPPVGSPQRSPDESRPPGVQGARPMPTGIPQPNPQDAPGQSTGQPASQQNATGQSTGEPASQQNATGQSTGEPASQDDALARRVLELTADMPSLEERQRSGAIAAPVEIPGSAGTLPRPAEAEAPAQRRGIGRVFGRGLRELAETIILALLIFLLVRAVVQNFQVEGTSMQPTMQTGWYLLVNKALYAEINLDTVSKFIPFIDPGDDPTRYIFRGPRRGDVIVFRAPGQQPGQPERDFIKRVIAVPGESVEVRDGVVLINGLPLDETYIDRPGGKGFGPEVVPEDHFFVLGDNRPASRDSRDFGMLPKENIIGKAWITYWPFSIFGFVNDTSAKPGSGLPAESTGEQDPEKDPAADVPIAASP